MFDQAPRITPVQESGNQQPQSSTASTETTPLAVPEVIDKLKAIIPQVDLNNDKSISADEIVHAMLDKDFKGDPKVLAALYLDFKSLASIVTKESWLQSDSAKGLSSEDFEKLRDLAANLDEHFDACHYLRENFQRLSAGNSYISGKELQSELQRVTALGDTKAVTSIENVIKYLAKYKDLRNDETFGESEISEQDCFALSDALRTTESIVYTDEFIQRRSKIDPVNSLYADPNDPLKSITPDAIKQGMAKTCHFLSTVAALANSNPEIIQQMLQDNNDGTYTVTFPGDPKNPVTIDAPTKSEQLLFNAVGKHGLWAAVLEKAYVTYHVQGNELKEGEIVTNQSRWGLGGAQPDYRLLTGGQLVTLDDSKITLDYARQRLIEAFPKDGTKEVVLADIDYKTEEWMESFVDDGRSFPPFHAYSVQDFDADGPDGGTVTVMNPHNKGPGTTNGVIQISLKDFLISFDKFHFLLNPK